MEIKIQIRSSIVINITADASSEEEAIEKVKQGISKFEIISGKMNICKTEFINPSLLLDWPEVETKKEITNETA